MAPKPKHRRDRSSSTPAARSEGACEADSPIIGEGGVDGADFIDQTLAAWQPWSGRQLSREDGRQIIENIAGFFRVLQEWDRAERAGSNKERTSRAEALRAVSGEEQEVTKEAASPVYSEVP